MGLYSILAKERYISLRSDKAKEKGFEFLGQQMVGRLKGQGTNGRSGLAAVAVHIFWGANFKVVSGD